MSTEQLEVLEQLARRAVACPRWRWMDGMRVENLAWKWDGPTLPYRFREDFHAQPNPTAWPDLTDPATLGCLLALVREAWGPEATVSVNISGFWAVGGARIQKGKSAGHTINLGIWKATELDALVSALEVAP